jgi:thymidylate synthase
VEEEVKQYHDLVQHVLDDGSYRVDRTGVGTLSVFGAQCRYDLRDGFPLVTTKKVNFSAVVKELLWFLRGETNIKTLGCGIWDAWADERGELGPIYGHQWRSWLAWDGSQVDQIHGAAQMLIDDPFSRRNIVSAWNVGELRDMALPPCHTLFQLHVSTDGHLDLQLYQRSADLALGVPFNIASYALLLHMFAAHAGLKPRYFIHSIGDAHVYLNHIEGLREQLNRSLRPLPSVRLLKAPDFQGRSISLAPDDIELVGYNPHPPIRFEVAV